jgi:hypothetical protein
MTNRVKAALPFLLAVVGCVDQQRGLLVPGSTVMTPNTSLRPVMPGPRVPESEASARRVMAVGRKLVESNPQAGLRPGFITVGLSHPEISHAGGGTNGYTVMVSEALVKQCKTDAELAAVLAMELGKIVAERESAAGPSLQQPEKRLPPDVQVGTDAGGTFGSSDGTRMMELAKLDPKRVKPDRKSQPPSPDALAAGYLKKAGYDDAALLRVAPLLIKAEGHNDLDKAVKAAELGAPVKAELGAPIKPEPAAEPKQ